MAFSEGWRLGRMAAARRRFSGGSDPTSSSASAICRPDTSTPVTRSPAGSVARRCGQGAGAAAAHAARQPLSRARGHGRCVARTGAISTPARGAQHQPGAGSNQRHTAAARVLLQWWPTWHAARQSRGRVFVPHLSGRQQPSGREGCPLRTWKHRHVWCWAPTKEMTRRWSRQRLHHPFGFCCWCRNMCGAGPQPKR